MDTGARIDLDGQAGALATSGTAGRAVATSAAGGPLTALVDALAIGVVALARDGRATYLNPCAAAIVACGDGVRLDSELRLVAVQPELRPRLASLIEAVCDAPAATATGGCVRLPRRGGGAYVALVAPGPLVLIHDPDRLLRISPAMVQAVFGLTRREAELTTAVCAGMTPAQFAAQAGVSLNTVRFHLKSVYAKTATRGQGDLIRLVTATLASLDAERFAPQWATARKP